MAFESKSYSSNEKLFKVGENTFYSNHGLTTEEVMAANILLTNNENEIVNSIEKLSHSMKNIILNTEIGYIFIYEIPSNLKISLPILLEENRDNMFPVCDVCASFSYANRLVKLKGQFNVIKSPIITYEHRCLICKEPVFRLIVKGIDLFTKGLSLEIDNIKL